MTDSPLADTEITKGPFIRHCRHTLVHTHGCESGRTWMNSHHQCQRSSCLLWPYVHHQIALFSGGKNLQVVSQLRHPHKSSFCSPNHPVQIYNVQLQTLMLTAFPISLSNVLVVVPPKGYLASQQQPDQFTGPQDDRNKDVFGSAFCVFGPTPQVR